MVVLKYIPFCQKRVLLSSFALGSNLLFFYANNKMISEIAFHLIISSASFLCIVSYFCCGFLILWYWSIYHCCKSRTSFVWGQIQVPDVTPISTRLFDYRDIKIGKTFGHRLKSKNVFFCMEICWITLKKWLSCCKNFFTLVIHSHPRSWRRYLIQAAVFGYLWVPKIHYFGLIIDIYVSL